MYNIKLQGLYFKYLHLIGQWQQAQVEVHQGLDGWKGNTWQRHDNSCLLSWPQPNRECVGIHEYYLQIVAKPRTKDQLIQGIKAFWETLSTPQCERYIDHIHKVIPYVVLNRGEASGY